MKILLLVSWLMMTASSGCDREGEPAVNEETRADAAPATPAAEPPRQPTEDGGAPPLNRDAVCARAARCCEAAFTIEGLPRIYASRHRIACASIEDIPDADGCWMAIRSWRGMVRGVPDAEIPADCREQAGPRP